VSLPASGPGAIAAPTAPAAQPSAAPAAQPPAAQNNQQYARFGQTPQEPASFAAAKPYEAAFAHQQAAVSAPQSQFDSGFQSQVPSSQPQTQQPPAAYTSAPSDFSAYAYDPQSRNAYNNYYQNFGQQGAQGQQENLSTQQQQSFGRYNAPQNETLSQYPQSGGQHGQSRYGSGSGAEQITGTPTPGQPATQAQAGQTSQAQSHQAQAQEYPYSHPYYNNPYYSAYMGYQGYNQGAYGAPYGKGGVGYQPNQYGITPQGPHGYASSPAGTFGQSTLHRESGATAGLGDYGRSTTGQSVQQQGLGGAGFSGVHDAFARGASAYQSQGTQSFNVPGSQAGAVPTAVDDLKQFGDAKGAPGPSPSLGAAARPGSATNNAPSQSGLPPPQPNQQSGLGGYAYPSHLQGHHGNQPGAGGYGMSAGGAQGHQNSYGGYGGQSFGGSYYGNPQRGGWGNQYH